ncbi:MAG: outer membrane protein assembly factor BamD [Pseudomonadales bacterium]
MNKQLLPIIIFAMSAIAGCGSTEEFSGSGEEFLYTEGIKSINISNWARSILIFQQLEAQFPFGQFAEQSQLELIYAYYRNSEPEAARAAADRFIRLYPDSESLDYAYYMKGMAYYSEDDRILGRYLPTDPSKRDPGKARGSFADFSQLLNLFPGSRSSFVGKTFQGAPAVPRALEIIAEMYLRLGLNDLADATIEILALNYPDSQQLTENGDFIVSSQITDPSFLYSVSFGLLGSNKKDAPLAPTRRPQRIVGEEEFIIPEVERPRSILNLISLGVLGDSGSEDSTETEEVQ